MARVAGELADIRICTLLPVPADRVLQAATAAIEENPANAPRPEALASSAKFDTTELAFLTARRWRPGRTLRVKLLGSDEAGRDRIAEAAGCWLNHANLRFEFVEHGEAEVRIAFQPAGIWSYLGTDCLVIDPHEPTMNIGSVGSQKQEYSRIVPHLFGHVLGFGHTHQHPVAGIPWDRERLYDYFASTLGWEASQVDAIVVRPLEGTTTPFSHHDPRSVMVCAIPNELTRGDFSIGWNVQLSGVDRAWAQTCYPSPQSSPAPREAATEQESQPYRRVYPVGNSWLAIEFSDITTQEVEVIVSSDDCYISMGGGVSRAIRIAGGESIRIDAAKRTPARVGDVVATTAGALPAIFVFHAITIGPGGGALSARDIVRSTTRRCMELLDGLGLGTIAFPAIGAGVAGFSHEDVALEMAQALAEQLTDRNRPVYVTLCLHGRQGPLAPLEAVSFFEEFARRFPSLTSLDGKSAEAPLPAGITVIDSEVRQRRRQARDLAQIDEELRLLVEQTADGATVPSANRLQDLARRHHEVAKQLAGASTRVPSIFLSYAREDKAYREGLEKSLGFSAREGKITVFHDGDIQAGSEWDQEIRQQLEAADIIILVISRDFIYSRYVAEVELKLAVERHNAGEAIVIPVIARTCRWREMTELSKLQALPAGGRPIAEWENADEAWATIDEGLEAQIERLRG